MKKVLIIGFLLTISASLLAQQFNYLYFEQDNKAEITIFLENGFETHHFNNPGQRIEIPLTDEWGNTHSFFFERDLLQNEYGEEDRASMSVYEPGILPEGDLPRKMSYSPDGNMLAVMNEHSDNVCYYDADTWALLADVPVGNKPMDMAITEDYTYVCCYKSNNVYVVDHSDFSIADRIIVEDNPVHIQVNSLETHMYVGFYSYNNGSIGAYDLDTHDKLYQTEMPLIDRVYFYGSAGRRFIPYSGFMLTKDDNYIVTTKSTNHSCIILESGTGYLVTEITDAGHRGMCSSSSGDTLFLAFSEPYQKYIYRYNLQQHQVIDSVVIPKGCGHKIPIVSNAEGDEALFYDGSNGELVMVDFNSMDYEIISDEVFVETLEIQEDRKFAFGPGGAGPCIIDMNSGEHTVNTTPTSFMLHGAIHPDAYEFVGANFFSNFNNMQLDYDNFYAYHFDNTGAITYDTSVLSGLPPEADMCFETAFSEDRSKLFVTNVLSGNISVIDMGTGELDSLLPIAFYENIARVPGSNLAILAGILSDNVALFSMGDYTIIDSLNLNACGRMLLDPNGQFAYFHRGNDQLVKVAVSDSRLELIDSVELVYSGGTISSSGIITDNFISPDGHYIIASDSEDQQVYLNIISTEDMELVKTLPVSGKLWDAAFTPDGKRACLGLAKETTEIIYLNGEQSFVEHQLELDVPVMWVRYYDGKFYLLGTSYVHEVDPEYGVSTVAHVHSHNDCHGLEIDNKGEFILLVEDKVYYEDLVFPLPGHGRIMQFDAETQQCVLPLLGPDNVCVIDLLATQIEYLPKPAGEALKVFPNPAGPVLYIESVNPLERVELFDTKGRCIFDKTFRQCRISIDTKHYEKGTYILKVTGGNEVKTKKVVIS